MGPTLLEASNPVSESEQPIISCNAVRLAFGTKAHAQSVLNDLSLTVHQGQIVSLLGPSGCGKSTLLRVIAGLIEADSGSVFVDGAKVARRMPRSSREKMSFVFQEPALLPWRTVWQNVILPSQLRGAQLQTDVKDLVEHLLGLVGFQESDWRKFPSQLSGGMKMRASIARAMSTQPTILLLDEPFAALDDMLRSKLNDLLLTIASEQKCTMLFVTHNISEAIYLSDAIAVMSQGRIAERLKVPFAFPRQASLRSTPEFAAYYGQVATSLARGQS
jgi:NitT/TauT family transport system ATP-binding protein